MSSAKNSPISVPSERVTTIRVTPAWPIRCTSAAAAAAGPAGDGRRSLEARITQLERGRPLRQHLAVSRLLASAGTLAVLAAASLCCAAMSQALPGRVL